MEPSARDRISKVLDLKTLDSDDGRRSAIAAQTLVELGYTGVRDSGGITDWPYDIEVN